ncbi:MULTISPECIES: tRNA (guanosine(37)-N1)-methyltransferase TrmD [unclassified Pseudodesulfovibrio]|uniref:tRNA (guanosine(37)-N1)-methyltransferase TrmD n=1 Tax=unclassified Pseudodesulfovibrio TaxID=2661612 RepID=UPI000FEB7D79|nr:MULTISPECIES: tRNA (guanosine(37)-N1)-methyltransferase TrmD [unclassified Pseudodesulfovibrio]MCJ2166147.1 tRNA (guanosine(37)-N1)-methyltransferase TrmD [Pseudodesulfovibrio sp. S3-i]RWU02380.1 tRNA (guanosine(37)-N1)-methyltransferase TrmD [Pseudodesulfovibrio sp. S3]
MNFHLVSIFPHYFESPLSSGLMGKAVETGLVNLDHVDVRRFAGGVHKSVDDRPFGGGPGMLLKLDPMIAALDSIETRGRILMLSPRGKPLNQAKARELALEDDLTLICGRYEGIDERLLDLYPIELVSVGDFVLNGGEAGAVCLMESVARLLPGFMGHEDSGDEESFSAGLLEYPHYTRPEDHDGLRVPEVLRSGDHAKIAAWRRECSLSATIADRPDLLPGASLTVEDVDFLRRQPRTRLGRNLYIALCHYPVVNKFGEKVAVSVTNLDLHDMARVARSYGLGGFYATTPIEDQKSLAGKLLSHWKQGAGSQANPDRAEAFSKVKVFDDIDSAVLDIEAQTGQCPRLAATSARLDRRREAQPALTYGEVQNWLANSPVLLIFGTGHGLAEEVLSKTDGILRPLRYLDDYNHLSVRSAVAIIVDRLVADEY